MLFYAPIFFAGMGLGGSAAYLFYLGRIRVLTEELFEAQRNN